MTSQMQRVMPALCAASGTGCVTAASAVEARSDFLRLAHSQLLARAQEPRSAVRMVCARRHLIDAIPLAVGGLWTQVLDDHVREIRAVFAGEGHGGCLRRSRQRIEQKRPRREHGSD